MSQRPVTSQSDASPPDAQNASRTKYLTDAARNPPDRATLAKLRRGLGRLPGESGAAERDAIVLRGDPEAESPWRLENACLVASLFGLHPELGGPGSLAQSLRRLAGDGKVPDGVERRFIALLNSDADDLGPRLRQLVSLLKANDVPFDPERLLRDLDGWDHPDRHVQRRWTSDFWGNRGTRSESATDA